MGAQVNIHLFIKPLTFFFLSGCVILFCTKCAEADIPEPIQAEDNCVRTEIEEEYIAALNLYESTFNTADPNIEEEALLPLYDYLDDAEIVGLGEATHGTAEFYQMKDKIFRHLVRHKGFKAIVFEIPWGNALVVNDFVAKNIGTAEASVDQTFYWTYDTQEVRELVQWIHDYNQGVTENEKIFFVGCDVQGGNFAIEKNVVSLFYETVKPDSLTWVQESYRQLPNASLNEYADASISTHEINIAGALRIYNHLLLHEAAFVANSSDREYQIALMAAHVILHRELAYRTEQFGVFRDSLMAVYTEWWRDILGEDAQVAVWAHNFHVMDATSIAADWMGTFLRKSHGQKYINVGFSFGAGSFNAFLAGARQEFIGAVRRQNIPESICHTINHVLTSLEGGQHYFIIKDLDGKGQQFFNANLEFTQLGAGFNYNFIHNYTRAYNLANLFDVIIHFDETTESDLK